MEETSNPQQAPGAFVDTRPSWDEYFMKLAEEVATRTTCLRRAVGAVVVKDRRILATGYNGVPTGLRHCAETGCLRHQLGVPSGQQRDCLQEPLSRRTCHGAPRRIGHHAARIRPRII